jgi:predicted dehydrogenase
VTRRKDLEGQVYSNLAAIDVQEFSYVVVANATASHSLAVQELLELGFRGDLLIEKPAAVGDLDYGALSSAAVSFNLRFHPMLRELKSLLVGQKVLTVNAYAGQWLPSWRPEDSRPEQYSFFAEQGGGVLRDLSHELDYLVWLFGPVQGLFALGGRIGEVTVDSDDAWSVSLEHENAIQASLQINYFDRPGSRNIRVNTIDHTYVVDLTQGQLWIDGDATIFEVDRDFTYMSVHRTMLHGGSSDLATIEQSSYIETIIQQIELSSLLKEWIRL